MARYLSVRHNKKYFDALLVNNTIIHYITQPETQLYSLSMTPLDTLQQNTTCHNNTGHDTLQQKHDMTRYNKTPNDTFQQNTP